jgi:hypothetical protein
VELLASLPADQADGVRRRDDLVLLGSPR